MITEENRPTSPLDEVEILEEGKEGAKSGGAFLPHKRIEEFPRFLPGDFPLLYILAEEEGEIQSVGKLLQDLPIDELLLSLFIVQVVEEAKERGFPNPSLISPYLEQTEDVGNHPFPRFRAWMREVILKRLAKLGD